MHHDVEVLHTTRLWLAWLGNDNASRLLGPWDAVLGSLKILLAICKLEEDGRGRGVTWLVLDAVNCAIEDEASDESDVGVGVRDVVQDDRADLRWVAQFGLGPSCLGSNTAGLAVENWGLAFVSNES